MGILNGCCCKQSIITVFPSVSIMLCVSPLCLHVLWFKSVSVIWSLLLGTVLFPPYLISGWLGRVDYSTLGQGSVFDLPPRLAHYIILISLTPSPSHLCAFAYSLDLHKILHSFLYRYFLLAFKYIASIIIGLVTIETSYDSCVGNMNQQIMTSRRPTPLSIFSPKSYVFTLFFHLVVGCCWYWNLYSVIGYGLIMWHKQVPYLVGKVLGLETTHIITRVWEPLVLPNNVHTSALCRGLITRWFDPCYHKRSRGFLSRVNHT